jgi:hypothetical protein
MQSCDNICIWVTRRRSIHHEHLNFFGEFGERWPEGLQEKVSTLYERGRAREDHPSTFFF